MTDTSSDVTVILIFDSTPLDDLQTNVGAAV